MTNDPRDTAEARRRLELAAPTMLDMLIERVAAFWGDWKDLPQKYRDSFRRDYPDHPIIRIERLVSELTGIDAR